MELVFDLEGTYYSSVIIKMYNKLPKIEFSYHIAKTLSEDIESVFMPLALNLPDIDQLPGTNMEYYLADEGLIYRTKDQTILVNTFDTPLLYMGAMESHPILLCDNREENNKRPVYSWIMNNTWETNFKMDLSGFSEFRYGVEIVDNGSVKEGMERLSDNDRGVVTFICG